MATADFKKYYILVTKKKRGSETIDATWSVGSASSDKVLATSFFTHLSEIIEAKADIGEKGTLQIAIRKILAEDTTNNARTKACKDLATILGADNAKMSWVDTAWEHVNGEIESDLTKPSNERTFKISQKAYKTYYTNAAGVFTRPENSFVRYYREKLKVNGGEIGPDEPTRKTGVVSGTALNAMVTGTTGTPTVQPTNTVTDPAVLNLVVDNNTNKVDNSTAQKRVAALEKKAARFNRFSNFLGRNGNWLGGLAIVGLIVGIGIATTGTSMLGVLMYGAVGVLASSVVLYATPVRHARIRSKIRERITRKTKTSMSQLKQFYAAMDSMENSAKGNHPNDAKTKATLAKNYLQSSIKTLTEALHRQSDLYDKVKERKTKLGVEKSRKLSSMPIALDYFIKAFVNVEQAIHKYNDDIAKLNETYNLGIPLERIDEWFKVNDNGKEEGLKHFVYKYYPNELNKAYNEMGIKHHAGQEDECDKRLTQEGTNLEKHDFETTSEVEEHVDSGMGVEEPVKSSGVVAPVVDMDDPSGDLV